MNYVPVAEKDFFTPPGKGIFFIFPVKAAVGNIFKFFSGKTGNTVFMNFRDWRKGGFFIERAAFLTFITAEDERRLFKDFYFLCRQVFLFLGNT